MSGKVIKKVCFPCGNKYGKDKGDIGHPSFSAPCDICGGKTITVQASKFEPINLNKEEENVKTKK